MSKLLIEGQPLQLLPTLAVAIGVNEGIVIQQLHWLETNPAMGKVIDGRKWVRMTLDEWRIGHFPFWSNATIKRTFDELAERGLVASRDDLNTLGFDRSLWYSIDRKALAKIEREIENDARNIEHNKMKNAHCKMKNAIAQDETTIPDTSFPDVSIPEKNGAEKSAQPPSDEKPVAPKKEKQRKPKEPKPEQPKQETPPAVIVYRSVRNRYPLKELYTLIDATVGREQVNLDKWRDVLIAWVARGYNPQNVGGALSWFSDGVPAQKPNVIPFKQTQQREGKAAQIRNAFELYEEMTRGKRTDYQEDFSGVVAEIPADEPDGCRDARANHRRVA